jgi:hypothetical protein
LLKLSAEDVDGWTDIPVGFRVKIKRIINEHSKADGGSSPKTSDDPNNKDQ